MSTRLMDGVKVGDTVSIDGEIAAWVISPPGSEVLGRTLLVMVGDDREHFWDTSRLQPLDDDEFCGSCGQVGCGHG